MNTDRESTKLNPEGGDGEQSATSGERRAALQSAPYTRPAAPFRRKGNDDDEWEAAMLGVSTGKRRLSIEMALVGFFGFPIVTVILFFASFIFHDPLTLWPLILVALALMFIVLLSTRRFSLALGGIAGMVAFYLLVSNHCGW